MKVWTMAIPVAVTGAGLFGALACGGSGSSSSSDPDASDQPVIDGSSQQDDPDGQPGDFDAAADGDAEKIVFATSSKQNGDLGGLAGADGICDDLAGTAGLEGSFKAWLSSPGQPAEERLTHADVPYVLPNGTKVADDWNDLVDGDLDAAINRDEDGSQVSGDVWTGTRPNGTATASTCSGFDSTGDFGVCGSSTATSGNWSDFNEPFCTSALRLYCVQQ